jgi:hypothetical protein
MVVEEPSAGAAIVCSVWHAVRVLGVLRGGMVVEEPSAGAAVVCSVWRAVLVRSVLRGMMAAVEGAAAAAVAAVLPPASLSGASGMYSPSSFAGAAEPSASSVSRAAMSVMTRSVGSLLDAIRAMGTSGPLRYLRMTLESLA